MIWFGLSFGQYNESAPWMADAADPLISAKPLSQQRSLDDMSAAFENYWKGRDHTLKGSGFKPYKRW
jgi:hypothetical protein